MSEDFPTFGIPTTIARNCLPRIPLASQRASFSAHSSRTAGASRFSPAPLVQSVRIQRVFAPQSCACQTAFCAGSARVAQFQNKIDVSEVFRNQTAGFRHVTGKPLNIFGWHRQYLSGIR